MTTTSSDSQRSANPTPDFSGFPIDLSKFRPVVLDPAAPALNAEQRAQLTANIALCRDAIIFFTAVAGARADAAVAGVVADSVQLLVELCGVARQTGQVAGRSQLGHEAGSVPGRAAGELSALEELHAEVRVATQVVGDAGADDAPADNQDIDGHLVVSTL